MAESYYKSLQEKASHMNTHTRARAHTHTLQVGKEKLVELPQQSLLQSYPVGENKFSVELTA